MRRQRTMILNACVVTRLAAPEVRPSDVSDAAHGDFELASARYV
jgi:hypothetical protein